MAARTSSSTADSNEPRMYKYVHEMTPEERLESLKEWAEEKKYVRPGEGGTFALSGAGGLRSMANGGPMPHARSQSQAADQYGGQYDAPVGPPSYRVATNEEQGEVKRKSVVKRWFEKRKEKKDAKRRESAPPYFP